MSILESRKFYKPFQYPWAFAAYEASEQMHWLPQEVPMTEDVRDWRTKLSQGEKHLLTQIFRFFTQGDIDVSRAYVEKYLPKFKPPEVQMMLLSIAARECVHIHAYSTLIDEIGLPETEYAAFLDYKEMVDKHEYLFESKEGLEGLILDIAKFSAFGEGLQLFSSFVMLLNFTRFGKMKGMGQIVSWSIRDETHHVDSMMKIYHTLVQENPQVNMKSVRKEIQEAALKMVELEDAFIDLAYGVNEIEGLSKEDLKTYVRYICNQRLNQLGVSPVFPEQKNNPLLWVDIIVFGTEHTNFFENRATDYAKGTISTDWSDAW